MNQCWIVDCGLVDYREGLALQKKLLDLRSKEQIPDVLLLVEHPSVITMGNKATEEMLKVPKRVLEQRGIPVYDVQRGGRVTYHGPGQIVGYAIRKISLRDLDAHLNGLEEIMLRTLGDYTIAAHKSYEVDDRHKRLPGAWYLIHGKEYKLGAIGVEVRDGITMHGFALNVNTNLDHFDYIDMCGFKDKQAVSMQKLLGHSVSLNEVKKKIVKSFGDVFKYDTVDEKAFPSLITAVQKFYSKSLQPEQ